MLSDLVFKPAHQLAQMIRDRAVSADEFSPFPVASEIKLAIQSAAKTLTDAGAVVEQWMPKLDFVAVWQIGFAVSVYNTMHSFPLNADAALLSRMAFMFREATQGDHNLRKLVTAQITLENNSAPLQPDMRKI